MALLKSIKDTYTRFIKQMCKIQWAVSHTLWAWAKRRFNINMFHIIGPTSSNVSAVLFTPWPIVIIYITMCLKIKSKLNPIFFNQSECYRKSPDNTDFGESKIPCWVKPCKLGTILVLKLGIGELTFPKSNFYQHLIHSF